MLELELELLELLESVSTLLDVDEELELVFSKNVELEVDSLLSELLVSELLLRLDRLLCERLEAVLDEELELVESDDSVLCVECVLSEVLVNELVLLASFVELELVEKVLRLVLIKPVELELEPVDFVELLVLELVETLDSVLEVELLELDFEVFSRNEELELLAELWLLLVLLSVLNDWLDKLCDDAEVCELVLPAANVLLDDLELTLEVLLAMSVL